MCWQSTGWPRAGNEAEFSGLFGIGSPHWTVSTTGSSRRPRERSGLLNGRLPLGNRRFRSRIFHFLSVLRSFLLAGGGSGSPVLASLRDDRRDSLVGASGTLTSTSKAVTFGCHSPSDTRSARFSMASRPRILRRSAPASCQRLPRCSRTCPRRRWGSREWCCHTPIDIR
jgi:hypothetical protein